MKNSWNGRSQLERVVLGRASHAPPVHARYCRRVEVGIHVAGGVAAAAAAAGRLVGVVVVVAVALLDDDQKRLQVVLNDIPRVASVALMGVKRTIGVMTVKFSVVVAGIAPLTQPP
jgi:uncharacterized membrane protein